mmetsp:Transcript_13573/g.18799  ORF Transcript_13573/g.18799 Transcript_13573/m.18799 type:complete len:133 (-) Transcript_13573:320-718(-)|eukprot:CAMPEP_0185262446 /NCGR_PEP_ID=MMETSP1359-20130426/10596_1 /TAXON_ID=552665 /ORGANISM="Bigelowiella longifila, Strain CCMP242" /LENGTH=132 /DNA_ID=CAMNT_0027849391 /DNA_START=148 /DNA_END=546 /DNA_ORIENTATION=+
MAAPHLYQQRDPRVPSSSNNGPQITQTNPDRLLPIANISRIMKQALPSNAKVAKEAKDCIQECVTEFIGFITSEASDRLAKDDRKTITGNDIIDSMRALGFNNYLAFLQVFLEKRRKELKGEQPNSKRRKKV